MANQIVTKSALRWIVLASYLILFGAGSWASSIVFPQSAPAQRWRPRRLPVGTELVGDRVCAGCHADKAASHPGTGMAMAMETIADSRVLTSNPSMTFRVGNYSYEINRNNKESIYS